MSGQSHRTGLYPPVRRSHSYPIPPRDIVIILPLLCKFPLIYYTPWRFWRYPVGVGWKYNPAGCENPRKSIKRLYFYRGWWWWGGKCPEIRLDRRRRINPICREKRWPNINIQSYSCVGTILPERENWGCWIRFDRCAGQTGCARDKCIIFSLPADSRNRHVFACGGGGRDGSAARESHGVWHAYFIFE